MATLHKHGKELYRFEAAGYRKAYMSDGTILKNCGSGWKLYAKVKKDFDPRETANRARDKAEQKHKTHPAYAQFVNHMVKIGNIKLRSYLAMYLQVLGDDIDGIWSELDDNWETRGQLSFEDINKTYKLYRAAIEENKQT